MTGTPECPNHTLATTRPPCMTTISGIAHCSLCGQPCCPVCGRHTASQLSRVTGYISNVGGWNEGKQQELKDRRHYGLGQI